MKEKNIDLNKREIDFKIEDAIIRLHNISEELKDIFVERNDVIDNSIKALVTGQTVLLIGPPGTAKSALTHELCSRIEKGRYFSWLLNRTSDPAEILGPYSIKEMENDKFARVTKNKLPQAEIAFLDEIFKCNEPTLNILLPLINEKIFYNDGHPIEVPLITLFAASNELPEEESLVALYDRMMFRMYVGYIGDAQNKMKMLKGFLNQSNKENKTTTITLDQLNLLREALNNVSIEDWLLEEYVLLMNALFQEGILISDRRQNEGLKVLRATALLDRRYNVELRDFKSLRDVLWNNLEDIQVIDKILMEKVVSPYKKEYNLIKKRYREMVASTKNLKDNRIVIEMKGSVELLYDKIKRLSKDFDSMEDDVRRNFITLEKEVRDYLDSLTKQIGDEEDLLFGAS